MFAKKLILATAACAVFALPVLPALSQTTAPTTQTAPVTPPGSVSPPASLTPPTTSAPGPVNGMFYSGSWMPTHWHATDAIGKAVYNNANEKVGDVEELLIDGDGRIMAAVIGVGGFLGIGEHKVAVTYQSFKMTRETNGKSKLVVDVDKASLMNAPVYKPTDVIKRT